MGGGGPSILWPTAPSRRRAAKIFAQDKRRKRTKRKIDNHPVVVWRKWTAATRVKKLQARVAELEEELAAARERIAELGG